MLVTLDSCPNKVTKNSIIRVYPPWLTVESKNTRTLMYLGVIHAEVVEYSGSSKSLEPYGIHPNDKGLLTHLFQSEVLWKCNCSKGMICAFVFFFILQL